MKYGGSIFAGPAAIVLMIFYYLIPFLIVAGASDSFAKLRPFLVSGSVLFIALGFYQSWRSRRSKVPTTLDMAVLWFSAVVVFCMILFPETIANFLANTMGG